MIDQDALDAFQRFQNWTRANRPELAAELGPMTFAQARIRLNQETGLNIPGDAWAHDAFDRYLQALKSKS